ncbi:MAG: protoporphyrinogen oxidase HemJ [Alphaproteobacteria bacterium]
MSEFLMINYEWLRALHIISIITWMAAMLYLPRLFVYHADAPVGGEISEQFKIMEMRLLRIIMTPAMIAAWIFGIGMLLANPALLEGGWMHVKLTSVIILSGLHGMFAAHVKKFARDERAKSNKFYRIVNEIPAVFMVIIVIMAVIQPF